MEGTTTLYTSIGRGGLERKFGSTMVAAPVGHSSDARCGSTYPFGPRLGIGEDRC